MIMALLVLCVGMGIAVFGLSLLLVVQTRKHQGRISERLTQVEERQLQFIKDLENHKYTT